MANMYREDTVRVIYVVVTQNVGSDTHGCKWSLHKAFAEHERAEIVMNRIKRLGVDARIISLNLYIS